MSVAESILCLREISLEDENLVENDVCHRLTGKPGLSLKNGAFLVPSTFLRKQLFASHSLTATEFLELLENVQMCLVSEVDCDSHEIPKVAQRIPTKDRKKGIRAAWRDSKRTAQNKVETIEISVFNADVTPSRGIMLTDDVLLVIEDGAGRISAALDELSGIRNTSGDISEHVLVQRDIVIQLNFDLSGDPIKGLKAFLAYNRDAKKITKGTTLVVENGLLSLLGDDIELSLGDRLSHTWVVSQLYSEFPVRGSVIEFLPWGYEGCKTTSSSFGGSGNASSLLTILNNPTAQSILRKSGVSIEEFPRAIDFAFRRWYELCPDARRDVCSKNNWHFASTLALSVMLTLGVRIWAFCGADKKKFDEILKDVFARHFKHHKGSDYLSRTIKKMTPDRFWKESVYFGDQNMFNSGAKNAQKIIPDLHACLDSSLEVRALKGD